MSINPRASGTARSATVKISKCLKSCCLAISQQRKYRISQVEVGEVHSVFYIIYKGVRKIFPGQRKKSKSTVSLARTIRYNARLPDPVTDGFDMKVLSSLKSAKSRHRDCKIVRRRGKVFVICKSNPRFKARQR